MSLSGPSGGGAAMAAAAAPPPPQAPASAGAETPGIDAGLAGAQETVKDFEPGYAKSAASLLVKYPAGQLTPQEDYLARIARTEAKFATPGENYHDPELQMHNPRFTVEDMEIYYKPSKFALDYIAKHRDSLILFVKTQFMDLYLKDHPEIVNDPAKYSAMATEALTIASSYVAGTEIFLKEHPCTSRYFVRSMVERTWYFNWADGSVEHLKSQTATCIEWSTELYGRLAGSRGDTQFTYFNIAKGNASGYHYGFMPYQHNFLVIMPKGHQVMLAPAKDPLTLIIDPWPALMPFVYPPTNNWEKQNPNTISY